MPRPFRRCLAPSVSSAFVFAAIGCCALLLAGCDSGGANKPAERIGVSGSWTGTLTYDNTSDSLAAQTFAVEMTLNDVYRTVTGTGAITLPSERLAFTVQEGLYDERTRNVRLTLIFSRPPQGVLSGNVSVGRDAIIGTISGPGLANGRATFALNVRRAS